MTSPLNEFLALHLFQHAELPLIPPQITEWFIKLSLSQRIDVCRLLLVVADAACTTASLWYASELHRPMRDSIILRRMSASSSKIRHSEPLVIVYGSGEIHVMADSKANAAMVVEEIGNFIDTATVVSEEEEITAKRDLGSPMNMEAVREACVSEIVVNGPMYITFRVNRTRVRPSNFQSAYEVTIDRDGYISYCTTDQDDLIHLDRLMTKFLSDYKQQDPVDLDE